MKTATRTKRPHEDWPIWKLARQLVGRTYQATAKLPVTEKFGLQTQMQRAAVSIILNISEGAAHDTSRMLRRYLIGARGSLSELETQLIICRDLDLLEQTDIAGCTDTIENLRPALQAFINTINKKLRK